MKKFLQMQRKRLGKQKLYIVFFLSYFKLKLQEIFIKYTPVASTCKNLVWCGAYGNTNIGDDLIFFALKQYIPKNISIHLSCRQKISTINYGVPTFYFNDVTKLRLMIKKADCLLLGGGGLFEYYQDLKGSHPVSLLPYLRALILARMYHKKYGIVGIGSNSAPLSNVILRVIFGDLMRKATLVITRDQKSYQGILNNNGNNKRLIFSFDPVFSLSSIVKTKQANINKTIGFLLWPFYLHPHFHKTMDIKKIYKDLNAQNAEKHKQFCFELNKLFEMIRSAGFKIVFPLFHFSDKVLLNELNCSYENTITFDSYFSQLMQCDIVVSMRYHVQITSIANNIPVLSIPVQEKMSALIQQFDLHAYFIDIEKFNAIDCRNILLNMLENKEQIKTNLAARFKKIYQETRNTYSDHINNFFYF